MSKASRFPSAAAFALAACVWVGPARADLTLTAAGKAEGFSLFTFATGFPSGPLGVAFNDAGNVLVAEGGTVRVFPNDSNNQTFAGSTLAQNYGSANAFDFAQVGDNIYLTQFADNRLIQVNQNGTFNQVIVSGLGLTRGVAADPQTGHLYVAGGSQIFDVNPLTKVATPFANVTADGVTISRDGNTLYAARFGDDHLIGYSLTGATRGSIVFDSGFIGGNLDGTVVGIGPLDGKVYANMNNGTFLEIDLKTNARTLIADGGSRGDFVTLDPDGSLMVTQTDRIMRLVPVPGGFVPEPSSVALSGIGFASLLGYLWRKRHAANSPGAAGTVGG